MCWLLGYAGLPAYVECSLLLATAPINLSWGSWEWYVITSGLPLQYPIEWRNIGWSEHIFGLRQKNVHAWICIPSNVASSSMIYLFTAELNDFSSISPWDMLQLIYTHIYIRTPSPCQVHPRELSVWRGDTEGVRLGCEFWGWWRMLVGPCWSLVTPNLFSGCIIVSSSNWVIYIYIPSNSWSSIRYVSRIYEKEPTNLPNYHMSSNACVSVLGGYVFACAGTLFKWAVSHFTALGCCSNRGSLCRNCP